MESAARHHSALCFAITLVKTTITGQQLARSIAVRTFGLLYILPTELRSQSIRDLHSTSRYTATRGGVRCRLLTRAEHPSAWSTLRMLDSTDMTTIAHGQLTGEAHRVHRRITPGNISERTATDFHIVLTRRGRTPILYTPALTTRFVRE